MKAHHDRFRRELGGTMAHRRNSILRDQYGLRSLIYPVATDMFLSLSLSFFINKL